MRIALFSDCYVPVINGVVTSIMCLKQALEREGHTVDLYVPSAPRHRDTEPGLHRFWSFTWPLQPEERFSVPLPTGRLHRMLRRPCDVVHVHTPFNLGLLGWWKARYSRIPMVFTHHTLWEEYVHYLPLPRSWGRALALGVCRFFFRRSRRIIAPSAEVEQRLRRQGVTQPIDVIPTGIDTEIFHGGDPTQVRQELGLTDANRMFLYIGRVGREKSLDFLLHTFARALAECPNFRFILIGDGPERPALEELARSLGLQEAVRFLGYRPRTQLRDYLAASRAFLFASQTETQGLVLLEAMAAGVPVLGVRASGTNEAVNDGVSGLLVDPQDQAGFLENLFRVGGDDAVHGSLAQAAPGWAEGFSSAAMARRMVETYQASRPC